MVVVVVIVDGLRWLCSVVVVVDGDSGCVWRLWWRVAVVLMVDGGGCGGIRMVVQVVIVDGSGIRWLCVDNVMVADVGGSGSWWLW